MKTRNLKTEKLGKFLKSKFKKEEGLDRMQSVDIRKILKVLENIFQNHS